jgi:FAD:protein FMN transferase
MAHHTYEFATTAMSTTVSVQIVGAHPNAAALAADALDWFRLVEAACSRFDPDSELVRLCRAAPHPTAVSPVLYELLRVALAVSAASRGAFDPTLGVALQAMGFDTHWRTPMPSPRLVHAAANVWRDIVLDDAAQTVTLRQPTLLDLGAVAKGFALDLAARALAGVAHCCIVAGGDLLCRGHNASGAPWVTAVVNPFAPERHACTVTGHAPEYAVCTSGDYARRTAAGHHLLDPRWSTMTSAAALRSVTVVAPQAAIADALATAAFVLGPSEGASLLAEQQVDGYLIGVDGAHHTVHGWGGATFARCDDFRAHDSRMSRP